VKTSYCLRALLAQSFSPFLAQDGRQVRRPSWIWATSLCYILLNKFVALVGSGRQTCRPSRDKKGLKDWAIGGCVCKNFFPFCYCCMYIVIEVVKYNCGRE
jgi:hypothetical protein